MEDTRCRSDVKVYADCSDDLGGGRGLKVEQLKTGRPGRSKRGPVGDMGPKQLQGLAMASVNPNGLHAKREAEHRCRLCSFQCRRDQCDHAEHASCVHRHQMLLGERKGLVSINLTAVGA